MGKLIEYHISSLFVAHRNSWVPPEELGQLIEFPSTQAIQPELQPAEMALEYLRLIAPPR
jgi:hypothetical protein